MKARFVPLAAALVAVTMLSASPASAWGYYHPPIPPKPMGGGGGGGGVPGTLICVGGSALGLIGAASAKGAALGNPLRWRSQVDHERIVASGYEKQFELTNSQAGIVAFSCGIGAFFLAYKQQQPASKPVVAKY